MKWIIIVIVLLMSCMLYAQQKSLDTSFVRFNAKMLLLADSYRLCPRTQQGVDNYMASTTDMGFEFVESSGFNEHVFIRMIDSPIWDSTVMESWPIKEPVQGAWFLKYPWGTEFIVAYNIRTNEFFRLKGFYTIDFQEFLEDLRYRARNKREYFMIKKKRLKQFEKQFWVESLDWRKLF